MDFLQSDKIFDRENLQSVITLEKFNRVFFPIQSQVEKFSKSEWRFDQPKDEQQVTERLL